MRIQPPNSDCPRSSSTPCIDYTIKYYSPPISDERCGSPTHRAAAGSAEKNCRWSSIVWSAVVMKQFCQIYNMLIANHGSLRGVVFIFGRWSWSRARTSFQWILFRKLGCQVFYYSAWWANCTRMRCVWVNLRAGRTARPIVSAQVIEISWNFPDSFNCFVTVFEAASERKSVSDLS